MNRPMDHQQPQPPKSAFDVRGRKQERLSEYFDFNTWPEKAERKVTRQELLAILTQKWLVEREMRWYRRLWRALMAKPGSGPQRVGAPEPGETSTVTRKP